DPELQQMFALLYHQTGHNSQALTLLNKIISVAPKTIPSLSLLARVQAALGLPKEAISTARLFLDLKPGDALMINFMARQLFQQGDYQQSLAYFQNALQLQPNSAPFMYDLAISLSQLGRTQEAIQNFKRALELQPAQTEYYFRMALCLKETGDTDAYLKTLAKVLELEPKHLVASYESLIGSMHACAWEGLDQKKIRLQHLLKDYLKNKGHESIPPGPLNYLGMQAQLVRDIARHYANIFSERASHIEQELKRHTENLRKNKIHIGYLSTDFYNHAVGNLTYKMFGYHDKARFKIHAYSLRHREDIYQKTIASDCDVYRDLSSISSQEATQQIIDDEIDILVDMVGYTGAARTEIMALRPAPVQITYLGYLSTMGANFIDYIIADSVVIPVEHESHYTEKIIRLPQFMVTSSLPGTGKVPTRSELGLPEDQFVFCSFNQSYKLEPTTFSTWMQILQAVPGSVLWLYAGGNKSAEKNLLSAAESQGIESQRIIFSPRAQMADHLARLKAADLCLDTFNVSGGATMVCALMAGLPVLSKLGERYLGRMGSSMNQCIKLHEMDSRTDVEYIQKAISLATQPELLASVRQKLQYALETNRLFNTGKFVTSLEEAYERIWENHCQGNLPCSISDL
ncbi:MAG: tetratricopeptide repeat protein, partial [Gammaproteobacteria bacterium]|nr:tetratricopeptide repeat protein [Gammaproteobacteria bacterium]